MEVANRPTPRTILTSRSMGDRIYRAVARVSGITVGLILFLIGLFLLVGAMPALKAEGIYFLTRFEWSGTQMGIGAILFWTLVIALVALVLALPVALAVALFITEYAPPKLRSTLTSLVDLLAAVPSLVFGIWGFFFLQPKIMPLSRWLDETLGFIPIFDVPLKQYSSSPLIAGIVVALMILPICAAVMREVFSRTPPGEKEAALALGSTRWGMIRTVVLTFGKGGIIGGAMLGLGRALGETIAVAIIISPIFDIRPNLLQLGANSIASHIALRFGEAASNKAELAGLMAAGLVLFLVTLGVNAIAGIIVSRSRSGGGVEI
jgi:phosphate transport system permease protein